MKNTRGGFLGKSLGMLLFWCKLCFYHINRLLAEFWVKWTPLVAWVVAQPLILAHLGINSTRMPSTRPNHISFYPQNTINILLICCKLILDVETEIWRGSDFDPFWHPFCWFFPREMTQNAHLTNHWVFSLQFFCNDVCLLQEHQNTKNLVICCSGWSGVDIWLWKVGFMPRPIAHGRRDGYLSSSGAMSLHAGLPSNAKLVRYPSRRPYPGSMPKPYPYWASDSPLWKNTMKSHNLINWIYCRCISNKST